MREDILQALSELIKEKTELKAEKIELNAIDDLDKLAKKMTKAESDMLNQLKKTSKQIFDAKSDLRDVSAKFNRLVGDMAKLITNVEKAAKELGVKINTSKYQTAIDNFLEVRGKIRKYLD